jgi:hypothetical protein
MDKLDQALGKQNAVLTAGDAASIAKLTGLLEEVLAELKGGATKMPPKRVPGRWKGLFTVPASALEPWTDEDLGHWEERSGLPDSRS